VVEDEKTEWSLSNRALHDWDAQIIDDHEREEMVWDGMRRGCERLRWA
jgi:hypothetical protein